MREKLTPELQLRFCDLIATGNYAKTACKATGITQATLHSWLNQGKEAKGGKYAEFYAAYQVAMATGESAMVSVIAESAKSMGDWRAAAWLLSHRHKKRWADKVAARPDVAVAAVGGGLVLPNNGRESVVNLSSLSDDQLAKYEIFINSLAADDESANDESKAA